MMTSALGRTPIAFEASFRFEGAMGQVKLISSSRGAETAGIRSGCGQRLKPIGERLDPLPLLGPDLLHDNG